MRDPADIGRVASSTLAWWKSPGLVYFLAVGEPIVAVKVGMLAATEKAGGIEGAVKRRLAQIQSSNHEPVQVLGVVLTSGEYPSREAEILERQLHSRFSHLARFKVGSRGAEWFNAAPELLQHIREVSVPPEQHGLLRTVAIKYSDDGGKV